MNSVDVIVPCYRYGHFLCECVESVLNQFDVSVRILIIDDASLNNTRNVATVLACEDPRVSVICLSTNKGHISTYNGGIEWASSDYMLLLSVDDYLLPGALSRATGLMDVHPEVGFTFGNTIELSDSGTETPSKTIIKEISDSGERILEEREFIEISGAGNLVATCSAVVRTELQNAWADIAMSCRTRATWKCGCVLPRTRRLALFPHVRAFIDAIAPTYRQHTIFF